MNSILYKEAYRNSLFLLFVTLGALLVSVFPAEAARTGVTVADQGSVSTPTTVLLPLKVAITDDGEKTAAAVLLADGNEGGMFTNGSLSGNCSTVLSGNPATLPISSSAANKAFCYSNGTPGVYTITVSLFVAETQIGESDSLTVMVTEPAPVEGEEMVDICHWNDTAFQLLSVNVSSLGAAHGAAEANDGDIIPAIENYPGQNLSTIYGQMTGSSVLANDCVVNPVIPDVVYGCMEEGATNYVPEATLPGEILCEFPPEPVDVCENLAENQSQLPIGYEFTGENQCTLIETETVVYGCFDEAASNYNPNATEQGEVICTYDEPKPERRSSSSGTRINRPIPQVLGVSATTTSVCSFITDYMQMGWNNDSFEVKKLQLFLNVFRNMFGGVENPVTGYFDAVTDANVKAFQAQYRSEVLDPWYTMGIVPHNEPTGFVYKTTKWKINDLVCPEYESVPNLAGEDLSKNVDLD